MRVTVTQKMKSTNTPWVKTQGNALDFSFGLFLWLPQSLHDVVFDDGFRCFCV